MFRRRLGKIAAQQYPSTVLSRWSALRTGSGSQSVGHGNLVDDVPDARCVPRGVVCQISFSPGAYRSGQRHIRSFDVNGNGLCIVVRASFECRFDIGLPFQFRVHILLQLGIGFHKIFRSDRKLRLFLRILAICALRRFEKKNGEKIGPAF